MYQILLISERGETNPVFQILSALAAARSRGVNVRVKLNRYFDYTAGETLPLARSLAAVEYLKSKEIEVVFAPSAHRLHDKVIVIDRRWVIEGSMNWTQTALRNNWESATLIDSAAYAREKLKRMRRIPSGADSVPDALGDEGPLLSIPAGLMTEKKYFPDLLRRKDERIFEAYLWFLKEEALSGKKIHELDDPALEKIFRLDPAKGKENNRREALRLLKKLSKRGYLEFERSRPGAPALVRLRLLKFSSPKTFSLPLAYFEDDFPRRLSFAGEFVYLLSRIEMTQSASPPWWWRPQEDLTETYHLHHTTLAGGALELQRENLLEVIRDDAPEGTPPSNRLANRYRVNRLMNLAVREEEKKRFIDRFGPEAYEKASHFADRIDEPNDFSVIRTILHWMSAYPSDQLEAAFAQVARYERNNPRRSLSYVSAILTASKRSP